MSQVNRNRFRLKEGGQSDIIILDATPDDTVSANEHHMKDAEGKWTVFEFCPKEYEICCLCEGIDRASSYKMFLTVLDLAAYKKRDGTIVDRTKRLMAITSNFHPEFYRLFDACMREHGTIRGMQLLMARDGSVNSAIGHPIMLSDGKMFDMVPEEEIVAEFGHGEERDTEGRLVKMANFDITPYDYMRMFKPPSAADLRARYGAGSPPIAGSAEDVSAPSWQGSAQRVQNHGSTAAVPPRTRSAVPPAAAPRPQAQAPAPQAEVPSAGGGLPSRTRTRPAPANAKPTAQAAPEPEHAATTSPPARVRTRPVGAAATTTVAPPAASTRVVRRSSAGVQNDLADEF